MSAVARVKDLDTTPRVLYDEVMFSKSRPSPPPTTITQLTPEQRARLDADAEQVAAEFDTEDDDAVSESKPRRGGLAGIAGRVASACTGAARRVRSLLTGENADLLLGSSAGFAKMVAVYGMQVAKEAVMDRVRGAVRQQVVGLVGGGGGAGGNGHGGPPSNMKG